MSSDRLTIFTILTLKISISVSPTTVRNCQLPIYSSIRFKCIKDPVWKPNKVGFFAKGREFESVTTNHQYTEIELAKMATFESLDYLPPWSEPYKKWLREMPRRLDWDRW